MNLKKYLSDRGYGAAFFLFCGLLVVMAVVSIGWGRLYISPVHVVKIVLSSVFSIEQTWTDQAASAIFMIRLPRVLSAMMIGAALALSGAAYQSVFKNPLVAPDMLGVSSGACVGASLAILLGLPSISVQIGAFIGGILAVICAVSIPKIIGKNSIIMLVLSGIIVSGLMSSVLGIIKYLADSETQLPEITYWQLGSLENEHTDLRRRRNPYAGEPLGVAPLWYYPHSYCADSLLSVHKRYYRVDRSRDSTLCPHACRCR